MGPKESLNGQALVAQSYNPSYSKEKSGLFEASPGK
jgi:hypothetical protein